MDELKDEEISGNPETNSSETDLPEHVESYKTLHLKGMYENWFIDYASYVILERAVPDVYDGLKPVQRRILHSMKELDDGRFHKVANIIGNTMKYHPHGDASIGDALVQLGQKDLMIDCQGNWGNILTGDSAAAPRYIEAKLSKFALEVAFNHKTTAWKPSYDGRNDEPVCLPVKFPLLLAQGVEGIAVGLSSKILPHNFIELIDGCIRILKNEDFEVYPDFPTGGYVDISKYNDGARGGRIRIRAKIGLLDKKTLVITEIPFGTNTSSIIESIITANDKGKIKIRKIDDNTAENVEILVHLQPGVSPDTTIDALYAFTDCEISVSPNACVIVEGNPAFLDVKEILRKSAWNTVALLKKELEIRLSELKEEQLFASLEKIFIEKRIYHSIEKCESWEEVLDTIDKGLKPWYPKFYREITRDDLARLTEIKIKRISKYNSFKADEHIRGVETEIEEVTNHLAHLIDYSINYYHQIRKKYGPGRERKTEIRNFESIDATQVAHANLKLYVNRSEGFAGFGLKKDEYITDCSDIDDIIVFREDGSFMVSKIAEKSFVGKNIIHIDVFKKNDDRTIYNVAYRDGKKGKAFAKRFPVLGITRDKEYVITRGTEGSKILYFSANPNGEAEEVTVHFRAKPKIRKLSMDFDFSKLEIRGRSSYGNTLTNHEIRKILKKGDGVSTLKGRDIWFDDTVLRLNADGRGTLLGNFENSDKILVVTKSGHYRLSSYELSNHYEEDILLIEKYDPQKVISVIYWDGELQAEYVKRFQFEATDKKLSFIGDHTESKLIKLSFEEDAIATLTFKPGKSGKVPDPEKIQLQSFIGVKSFKARGKRLSVRIIESITLLETAAGENEPVPEEQEDNTGAPESDLMVENHDDAGVMDDTGNEEPETAEPEKLTQPDHDPEETAGAALMEDEESERMDDLDSDPKDRKNEINQENPKKQGFPKSPPPDPYQMTLDFDL